MSSDPRTQARMDAILERPHETLIGLDFDGTLAPIIDDPDEAYADPRSVAALTRLGPLLGAIVVITGRPARTAVRLGGFSQLAGLEHLVVLGQYGVERWDALTDEYVIPPDPNAVSALAAEIPGLLDELGLAGARVEWKGRAVGVHTRQLPQPEEAFNSLAGPLRALAEKHGLLVEPGKNVLEIRAPGVDKGVALREILAETGATQVIYAGDDLGDLPAYRLVDELRTAGTPGLLVCSASHEEDALSDLADVVLDGPAGVAAWLTDLADTLESRLA